MFIYKSHKKLSIITFKPVTCTVLSWKGQATFVFSISPQFLQLDWILNIVQRPDLETMKSDLTYSRKGKIRNCQLTLSRREIALVPSATIGLEVISLEPTEMLVVEYRLLAGRFPQAGVWAGLPLCWWWGLWYQDHKPYLDWGSA